MSDVIKIWVNADATEAITREYDGYWQHYLRGFSGWYRTSSGAVQREVPKEYTLYVAQAFVSRERSWYVYGGGDFVGSIGPSVNGTLVARPNNTYAPSLVTTNAWQAVLYLIHVDVLTRQLAVLDRGYTRG